MLTANKKAKGEVVNVGNAQEVTILELARRIKEITKCKSSLTFHPLPKDDPRRRCPDTCKTEKVLWWKPKISLEEGFTKTIMWFQGKSLKDS